MRPTLTASLAVVAGAALGGLMALGLGIAPSLWGDQAPATPQGLPRTTQESPPLSSRDEAPVPDPTATPRPHTSLRAGVPTSVEAATVGIRAQVTPIEVVAPGRLLPPSDCTTVGWWRDGARPGSGAGAVLLSGHTVHTGGGVFDRLSDLAVGDQVVVGRRSRDLLYVVRSVTTYAKPELAGRAATLFRPAGPERLVLVTCDGWDGARYRSNVVVTATDPKPLTQ